MGAAPRSTRQPRPRATPGSGTGATDATARGRAGGSASRLRAPRTDGRGSRRGGGASPAAGARARCRRRNHGRAAGAGGEGPTVAGGAVQNAARGAVLVDHLEGRRLPRALPEHEERGPDHGLEVRWRGALIGGAGRDRVVEVVEPPRRERVQVHGKPLPPDLLAARLDLRGDIAAGAPNQRSAQPVAGEAV